MEDEKCAAIVNEKSPELPSHEIHNLPITETEIDPIDTDKNINFTTDEEQDLEIIENHEIQSIGDLANEGLGDIPNGIESNEYLVLRGNKDINHSNYVIENLENRINKKFGNESILDNIKSERFDQSNEITEVKGLIEHVITDIKPPDPGTIQNI